MEQKLRSKCPWDFLGGMEKGELMDTLESEEDREKQRKLEETCEGKLTRPSEDAMFLRREIIDALKSAGEKMESYSRETNEKMESYSRKTDEKIDKFLQKIMDSVGTQPWDELIHCENARRRRQIQANQ